MVKRIIHRYVIVDVYNVELDLASLDMYNDRVVCSRCSCDCDSVIYQLHILPVVAPHGTVVYEFICISP